MYVDGDYIAKSDTDIEANNLVRLLKLDDPGLADKRKRYIARKRSDMEIYEQNPVIFFSILIEANRCDVLYLRAIKEEFEVDIWEML